MNESAGSQPVSRTFPNLLQLPAKDRRPTKVEKIRKHEAAGSQPVFRIFGDLPKLLTTEAELSDRLGLFPHRQCGGCKIFLCRLLLLVLLLLLLRLPPLHLLPVNGLVHTQYS